MQYFKFAQLVKKYSSEFTVITSGEGGIDDRGYRIKGEKKEISLFGAVIGRGENTIFSSDCKITEKDKRLFMLEKIDNALLNAKVVYENEVFTIQSSTENAKFTGVWAYVLKFVSAFKDGDGE